MARVHAARSVRSTMGKPLAHGDASLLVEHELAPTRCGDTEHSAHQSISKAPCEIDRTVVRHQTSLQGYRRLRCLHAGAPRDSGESTNRTARGVATTPPRGHDGAMHSIITVSMRSAAVFTAMTAVSAPTHAEVVLDTLFQDHAVLQRDRIVPVRGSATPGEALELSFGTLHAKGVAGADGRFSIDLPPMAASTEARVLTVRGKSGEATASDLLVGEVWFCSGQSNMEWTVEASHEADRAKSMASKLPLRSFKAPHVTANTPAARVEGGWRVATGETVGSFTAVGFWFGVNLARGFDLEVPIGLVDISWGGTRIEPWIPLDSMAQSAFKPTAEALAAEIAAFRARNPSDLARAQAEEDARVAKECEGYWHRALSNEIGQREGWSQPAESSDFPTGWSEAKLPAFYPALDPALGGFDGFVWFTREFKVPAEYANTPLTLHLPAIDDGDHVWIDGQPVGNTIMNWNTPRHYALPKGLTEGAHRIVVCVLDVAGQGGFADGIYSLTKPNETSRRLSLGGPWHWRKGGGVPQVAVPVRRDIAREPGLGAGDPAAIYNAMMAPCIAFPARGALWYQGESNAGESDNYRKLLPLLMESWRVKSGNPALAWGVVQLAGFMPFVEAEPAQGAWALLREAQFRGTAEGNSTGRAGMISATDLGDTGDIHPKRKREVGDRLAAWARCAVYGESSVAWRGPELKSAQHGTGGSVVCTFDAAEGLAARGGTALGGFALAAADGKFVWAKATIDGARVVVEAEGVTDPVEVVYAWQNNPERANLVNGAGFPAIPFRAKISK